MTPTPPAADPPRIKPIAAAEVAVRRFLLMVGFGFAAFVGGMIVMATLRMRLGPRLENAGIVVEIIGALLMANGWVIIFLPAIGYLAARFLEVRPWPTAIIGAATGFLFQVALQYVSAGVDGVLGDPLMVPRLIGVAVGVVATAFAVKRGRELARVAEEKAKIEAEKKKTQYDEFVKQAEALADRREQVPIAPQAPAAEPPPAAPPTDLPKP